MRVSLFYCQGGYSCMPANYVNLFFLCNSVTYPAIKHTCYEGYRAFSSGVYAADWILGWKKAVFVSSLIN